MAKFDVTTLARGTALADNTLGPEASYIFRKFWKDRAISEESFEPKLIDFWYGSLFHGRVDPDGAVIYPSETNLKQLPSKDNVTYFALDFVADAFADYKRHMQQALLRRRISAAGNITRLKPRKAWVSVHKSYGLYMESLYDHLVTHWFQKNQRNSKIRNFSDFLREFMELVNSDANTLMFTESAFILSQYFSPLSSGLIIELSDASHARDIVKQAWVKDPNFTFYRNAARNFGFLIDKNAPWRLVADINSPVMAKYMKPYGVTGKDLFETYYYKCHLTDMEALKIHLVGMYNTYVIAYPQAKEFRTKLKGAGGIQTVSRLVGRIPVSEDYVDDQYSPQFWLKTYYYTRLREMRASRDPVQFNKTLEKIFYRYKMVDIETALGYIDSKIRRLRLP